MKIAITSGKGGVGKTFVATSLADVLSKDRAVSLIDCDVEAPNAHLFLRAEEVTQKTEFLSCIESVDLTLCDRCGVCAKTCYFNAIVVGKRSVMTFPELCRWCGACQIVCPHQALKVGRRKIGDLFSSQVGAIDLRWGMLETGAGGMTTALIDKLTCQDAEALTILDSPPGTSCPVVHTVRDADCVVLVTDPTRFGVHDLKLSVRMCRSMGIEPCVVVNRVGIGDLAGLEDWCRRERLDIVGTIGDQREIAEYYSAGKLATHYLPDVKEMFERITSALMVRQSQKAYVQGCVSESVFLSEPKELSSELKTTESFGESVEVLVVSGKGGSGKTSLSACFGQLAQSCLVDCDVDAADLHLLFEPDVMECDDFIGGRTMRINPDVCVHCGRCADVCRFDAIERTESGVCSVRDGQCEGCGACVQICPAGAIETQASHDGRWYVSKVRAGLMSHATLSPGKENSGKLVSLVRKNAAAFGVVKDTSAPMVLDGAPGMGCPVIASVGGVQLAVLVAEPTISGMHDLRRIYELAKHFHVPCGIVINKADINLEVTYAIQTFAEHERIDVLGRLPYSSLFNQAQQQGQTVLEHAPESEISGQIKSIWKQIMNQFNERSI